MLARQVEKLARHLACWHAKLKHWHAIWHVDTPSLNIGTPFGMLARQVKTLARRMARWHVYWHVKMTLALKPR